MEAILAEMIPILLGNRPTKSLSFSYTQTTSWKLWTGPDNKDRGLLLLVYHPFEKRSEPHSLMLHRPDCTFLAYCRHPFRYKIIPLMQPFCQSKPSHKKQVLCHFTSIF